MNYPELTVERLAAAFEAWERDVRQSPRSFMTAEDCAAAGVSEISAQRASHLYALLESN